MRIRLYKVGDTPEAASARQQLEGLQKEFPHRLAEVDLSAEPTLQARFRGSLPAIEVGPYTLRWPFSPTDLRITLAAAQDHPKAQAHSAPVSAPELRRSQVAQRWVLRVARYWLGGVNLFVFLMLGLPFLAPVLMKAGATRPARWIYTAYSPLCHQLGYRSWYLFGEQPAYPRSLVAGSSVSFREATGLQESDFAAARAFLGNEQVGYKVAFCQRDVAMYGGILLAGLAFAASRRRWPELPLWAWAAFGVFPIALDGGTQLLGGWGWIPWVRESTPLLRTFTGLTFGAFTVWFAYPQVETTMAETRALLRAQLESRAAGS